MIVSAYPRLLSRLSDLRPRHTICFALAPSPSQSESLPHDHLASPCLAKPVSISTLPRLALPLKDNLCDLRLGARIPRACFVQCYLPLSPTLADFSSNESKTTFLYLPWFPGTFPRIFDDPCDVPNNSAFIFPYDPFILHCICFSIVHLSCSPIGSIHPSANFHSSGHSVLSYRRLSDTHSYRYRYN